MAVFNGNRAFTARKKMSQPVVKCPGNVRNALNIDRAYQAGIFKIEPQKKQALYDRCYVFEDINYVNKNQGEQRNFLLDLMFWLNSMNVQFKITFANEYQDMDEFLASIRTEKNEKEYPDIVRGMRQWQEAHLHDVNPSVTTMRYLTVTCTADSEENARIYLNSIENTVMDAFAGWGSRIEKLDGPERLKTLHAIACPGKMDGEFIQLEEKRNWKNDVLPKSIRQYRNFMIFAEDTYVSVLFGWKYGKSIDSNTFIRNLTNLSYPSVVTLDLAPVETEVVNDKLVAAMINNDREIADELNQKHSAGIPAISASYTKEAMKQEIEAYIDQLDSNDEKGFFMNLLCIVTASSEKELAQRIDELQAVGRKEKVVIETCDFRQLKAWNTALPIGGRQVDYMRFFLTSSLVAFQPYHAQDVIEPGGQFYGINKTTHHFIIGNRKKLPNPHGIIIGFSGSGKSMLIKLTELSQTLAATDDDIMVIDPQNEFKAICMQYGGAYFDLTPKSGMYLNGFEVSDEVFMSDQATKREFIATQTEYAKSLCAAVMKNITVTQEHDSVISKCTERMFAKIFVQKKLKQQPTLSMLREEIRQELVNTSNQHDEKIIRSIYNCLEEYTDGSCDMLSRPSTVKIQKRLTGFGMGNVPENNWEAVMVTVLHYLSTRMNYNKKLQRATHLIVDEAQVVSKKPGSADQLNNAVITFRKFGGIVTMAMQNVTAALSNPTLVELFQNCSYKCFLDQGGVDAKSLAEIQELSEKEFRALGTGKIGEGVMVWNKKVLLFNAALPKDNVLYQPYNTDFHEIAAAKEKNKKKEQSARKLSGKKETAQEKRDREYYEMILQLAKMVPITANDVSQILEIKKEESEQLLEKMEKDRLLVRIASEGETKYKEAAL